jgi:hypothetical protein
VGHPRPGRCPDPTRAQRQPAHLQLRTGDLARVRVRGGAAVQRRVADELRPERHRARRLRHRRRHHPALQWSEPGRTARQRAGCADHRGADARERSASRAPVAGPDAATPQCAGQ